MTKSISKIIALAIFTVLIITYVQPIMASQDNFELLKSLSINKPLPKEVISKLNLAKTTDAKIIYSAPSHRYDYPFIVHTDLNGIVIFIQLVIPENQTITYLTTLTPSLGKPENVIKNTEIITLAEYPSKGITLHTDPQGEMVYLVQKYLPVTPEIHRQEYGSGYKELTIPQYNTTETNPTKPVSTDQKSPSVLVIVSCIICIILSIAVIVWIILKRRNKHTNQLTTPRP